MTRPTKLPVHTTVDYFWVPDRTEEYRPSRVSIPTDRIEP